MMKASLSAAAAGLLFGLAVHFVTVYFRDHGPSGPGWSLRGNGAIIFLFLAPIGLIVGELLCLRYRAWLGMALLPLAILAGLLVVAGGI